MKYPRLKPSWKGLRRYAGDIVGRSILRSDQALWRGLAPALTRSASKGCTFHQLGALYTAVLEKRPGHVLELGSGISTIVLGYAAKRVRALGQPCHIVSMEESAFYRDDLLELLPSEIADCVDLVLSSVEDRMVGGLIGRFYTGKPRHPYSLVFIDGPQVPEARHDPTYFDADLLDVAASGASVVTAYVDSRQTTCDALRQLLPGARFREDRLHKWTEIELVADRVAIPATAHSALVTAE